MYTSVIRLDLLYDIKINDVQSKKTQRPYIKIGSLKGLEQTWLFDTGAGLTCMSLKAFRNIDKEYRPSQINAVGSRANGASGTSLIPEGVYMIPMERKKNYTASPSVQKPSSTHNPGNRCNP